MFIGSCMTNIGHYRAAGKMLSQFDGQLSTRLWIAPPTKMDEEPPACCSDAVSCTCHYFNEYSCFNDHLVSMSIIRQQRARIYPSLICLSIP